MHKIIFIYITFILIGFCPKLHAQNMATIKGVIKNEDGKILYGVHILNTANSQTTTSDKEGAFLIHCEAGKNITLEFTHIAYQTLEKEFSLKSGQTIVFNPILKENRQSLDEVNIAAQIKLHNKGIYLQTKEIDKIASAGGESIENLLKTLPGVSSNNELSSQYSVRGGNFDENLVYINDIEVYRPNLVRSSQQEGLSVINPDLVSSVLFSPGGFDAKYGDKLSSVLDIKYKTPRRFAA